LIAAQDDSVPKITIPLAKIVLHLLPVATFDLTAAVNISMLETYQWGPSSAFPRSPAYRRSPYFNFEGYLIQDFALSSKLTSYVQIFRSGAIESVRILGDEKYIDNNFEILTIRRVRDYLKIQQDLEIQTPVIAMLSLLGVKDYPLIAPPDARIEPPKEIDRELLPLPECVIDDFGVSIASALRPAFDALYQAAGAPRSSNYDENGDWIGDSAGKL
jgi:hypothetical protein